jgi:hypothetical protein
MFVGLVPVLDLAVGGELVEVRAWDRDVDALVLGEALRDLRTRNLDPVELDVATPAQLEPENELQLRQRRNLLLQPLDGLLDQFGR